MNLEIINKRAESEYCNTNNYQYFSSKIKKITICTILLLGRRVQKAFFFFWKYLNEIIFFYTLYIKHSIQKSIILEDFLKLKKWLFSLWKESCKSIFFSIVNIFIWLCSMQFHFSTSRIHIFYYLEKYAQTKCFKNNFYLSKS